MSLSDVKNDADVTTILAETFGRGLPSRGLRGAVPAVVRRDAGARQVRSVGQARRSGGGTGACSEQRVGPALRRTRPKRSGSPRFHSRALGTLGANGVASARNLSTHETHRRARPSGCFLQATSVGALFSYLEKTRTFSNR